MRTRSGPGRKVRVGSAKAAIGGSMPKLTDRFLAALTVENGRKDRLAFDTTCPGLGVRVTAKGTRTFIAQWTDPATRR
jgi:hypothetical protein